MITQQRHPSRRVTPVEVGDTIRWATSTEDAIQVVGVPEDLGCRYMVSRIDDAWEAVQVFVVVGHGGQRDSFRSLRMCVDRASAMIACQDAEHLRAWARLTDTARELLTHLPTAKADAE